MFSQPDRAGFLPLDQLPALVGRLMQLGYRCLGPAVENGAIVMRELDAPDALPRGLQAEQAPGRYRLTQDPQNRYFAWASGPQAIRPLAFAPKESLWRVERDALGALLFEAVIPDAPAQALIGVRACDLAALALQDAHFLHPDRRDAHYAQRRAQLFLVAVQCAVPAATCFCASTGDGPTPGAGYDLALTGFDDAEIEALVIGQMAGEGDGTEQDQEQDGIDPDAADDVPDAPIVPVSRAGDVWALGAHRLICGDASDPAVVATLMQGEKAALCFTSPPYGNQRDYTSGGVADWDGLMRGVFTRLPMAEDGQALVNLGLIHRDNEVIPYWDGWLSWMRTQGWRRFAWYVWDQGPGMPGDWAGRMAPSFEFVFHFNRQSRKPNKIVPCKHAGQESHLRADGSSTAMRSKEGEVGGWTHAGKPTQDHRIPDSVIRVMRHKGKIGHDIDHPAVFPVALPEFILQAYSNPGDIVFEPFGGSGTSMLAAQRTGRHCRCVEIAPEYVDVAIKRFQQNFPGVPVTLLSNGQSFDAVAAKRLVIAEPAQ